MHYTSTGRITTYTTLISFCLFDTIRASSAGGCIYIDSSSTDFEATQCVFWNCYNTPLRTDGGAVAVYSRTAKMDRMCFQDCNSVYGFGTFYLLGTGYNRVEQITCAQTRHENSNVCYGAWGMNIGESFGTDINSTLCVNTYREAAGHYAGGPLCTSKYLVMDSCEGKGVFGPYCITNVMRYHSYLTFHNCTATGDGLVMMFKYQHCFQHCYFAGNTGPVCGKTGQYQVETQFCFVECYCDGEFSVTDSQVTDVQSYMMELQTPRTLIANNCALSTQVFSEGSHAIFGLPIVMIDSVLIIACMQ